MRKQYLLFLLVLAVSFLLFSCETKGGSITVHNSKGSQYWTVVVKGDKNVLTSFENSLKEGEGKGAWIQPNQSHTFNVDEDGAYIVGAIAVPNPVFTQLVPWVALGSSHNVEIK